MSTGPLKTILAAVDLSSCSRAALEFACRLAAPFGAKLDVLFVRRASEVTPAPGLEPSAPEALEAALVELRRFVASVGATQGLPISERVETGDARERIVALADGGGYDAVVLGTHGRTGRPRSLAGSVAESVVRTASCPVITVREPR
jgi:nucleotide-binding universal stress UspA family protein